MVVVEEEEDSEEEGEVCGYSRFLGVHPLLTRLFVR